MNKIIYIIASGIVGLAIGGGVSYIYLNKKHAKVFDIETQSYKDKIIELSNSNKQFQERLGLKNEEEKERIAKSMKTDHNVSEAVVIDNPDDVESDDIVYDAERVNSLRNHIRYISRKDYADDEDYEKEEFKYFMLDGVITENEEILGEDEFIQVCGESALGLLKKDKSLKSISDSDNELYIRNEEYDTDYKVIRYHMSYENYIK